MGQACGGGRWGTSYAEDEFSGVRGQRRDGRSLTGDDATARDLWNPGGDLNLRV